MNQWSDWCGLVGWASSCKLKVHWFDSQRGHMSGLHIQSPDGGVQEASNQSFSPPSPYLKINK